MSAAPYDRAPTGLFRLTAFAARMPAQRIGLFVALAYFLLIGGSQLGLLNGVRLVSAVIGSVVVLLWIRALRRHADQSDLLTVTGLVLFLVACITSQLPRFSFDSALTALGFVSMYGLARRELSYEPARRQLVVFLAVLGALFAALLAISWGGAWLRWISLTGTTPPLGLALSDLVIYWYKYQLAILLGMLVPFSLALPRVGLPRVVAAVVIIASLILIYMSGARSAWIGVGAGAIAMLAVWPWGWRPRTRAVIGLLIALAVLVLGSFVAGIGQQLVNRVFAGMTVGLRFDTARYALQQFWSHPVTGYGPGTYPSLLTLSGFFQHFDVSNRGPDSSPVQILAESGIVGLATVLLLGWSLVSACRLGWNRWTPYALAAVAVFVVSSLTNDSVHSPQLVALAVVAAALGGPVAGPVSSVTPRASSRTLAVVTYAAAGVVGAAMALTLVASQLLTQAAEASASGRPQAAVDLATWATRLDPTNGYLQRERGLALLQSGNARSALDAFDLAGRLSPADATALRSAALTASELGLPSQAMSYSERAADLRANDPANLELLAVIADRAGQPTESRSALIQLLTESPSLPASREWPGLFGDISTVSRLLEAAAAVEEARPADPLHIAERAWLLGITNRDDSSQDATSKGFVAFMRCDDAAAARSVSDSLAAGTYAGSDAVLDAMIARLTGHQAAMSRTEGLAGLVSPILGPLLSGSANGVSPFSDTSEDLRLYWVIQEGVRVPAQPIYPSAGEGLAAWLANPKQAALLAAPDSGLAQCSR